MKYICCCLLLSFIRVAISHPILEIRIVNPYPMNGTVNVQPCTGIGITYLQALNRKHITSAIFEVIGSLPDNNSGALKVSTNRRTLIFTPTHPFVLGENIEVRASGF